jgi:hypothetical protein
MEKWTVLVVICMRKLDLAAQSARVHHQVPHSDPGETASGPKQCIPRRRRERIVSQHHTARMRMCALDQIKSSNGNCRVGARQLRSNTCNIIHIHPAQRFTPEKRRRRRRPSQKPNPAARRRRLFPSLSAERIAVAQ